MIWHHNSPIDAVIQSLTPAPLIFDPLDPDLDFRSRCRKCSLPLSCGSSVEMGADGFHRSCCSRRGCGDRALPPQPHFVSFGSIYCISCDERLEQNFPVCCVCLRRIPPGAISGSCPSAARNIQFISQNAFSAALAIGNRGSAIGISAATGCSAATAFAT
jgi:hypothetical protein